ncbi:CgeB family protein [Methylobacterium dankookense]|uniref:Spore protein YkvP/CgeB glycosyl transferase-like domain-containing protein n=1 Tax=Methylobacterium dankookense TaxID=560405 RepID=A0A564FT59_9HYPH|nr:glycosyltransferase [Methylobacterium dankookense]GJD55365.1 hypothetical protein IFDJLNFL_1250 [Methylobacterium dankookense]VUF11207.1 hypothetical protein MTDSW087_00883 [Methylobacterium dankookense]
MSAPRVLITSTFRDSINTNAAIRTYLADGFAEVLGVDAVAVRPLELAPEAVLSLRPDLVIAVGSLVPDDTDLRGLRRAVDTAGGRLALWLHDDPYEFDYAFKAGPLADILFSNDSWSVPHYRHGNVHHLPLAGAPRIHLRGLKPMEARGTALFFCGVAYDNRIDLIRRADALLARHPVAILGSGWPEDIHSATNRRLDALQMADHAANARLTLNIGRDLDIANRRYGLPAATPGPRTFEVALSGSAQLYVVSGLEICTLFEPDEEILLVDSVRDIERAIERAYDDPQSILAIARAAQGRALRDHTYAARARRILDLCGLAGD